MTIKATVTIGETSYYSDGAPYASVIAECPKCGHKVFTSGNPGRDWSGLIDDHLAQHAPGRAIDIEVDWEPSASCSVCENGIGDIYADGDGLTCRECGTSWDIDGTSGYREDQ